MNLDALAEHWKKHPPRRRLASCDWALARKMAKDSALQVEYVKRFQAGESWEPELVGSFSPLMHKLINKYQSYDRDWADFWQELRLATLKALLQYDPARGLRPITYVMWWLRAALRRYAMDKCQGVRLPVHAYNANHRDSRGPSRWGKDGQLRKQYGAAKLSHQRTSLFSNMKDAFSFSSTEAVDLDFEDLIEDEGPSPEELSEDEELVAPLPHVARRLLACLTTQERLIVKCRVMPDREDAMTLNELGTVYGVSRERIRQIEETALEKLRARCKALGAPVAHNASKYNFGGGAGFWAWCERLVRVALPEPERVVARPPLAATPRPAPNPIKARTEKLRCAQCGTWFRARVKQRGRPRKFCSKHCAVRSAKRAMLVRDRANRIASALAETRARKEQR